MRPGLVAITLLAGITSLVAPRRADACSPASCTAWKDFTPAFGATIPAEGVLVFEYTFGEYDAPSDSSLDSLTFTVKDGGGVAVAGTLALGPAGSTLVWRPDAPLSPGTSYAVEIFADNTSFPDAWCAEPTVTVQADFGADALGLPTTVAPPVEAAFTSVVRETFDLAALVCCDDAVPYYGGCGGPPWDTGFCASTQAHAWLNAELTLDATAWAAARGQLGFIGFGFGSTSRAVQQGTTFCVTPETINFATGETVQGPELCPDAAVEAELGPLPVDPGPALAAMCVGQPYTCSVDGGWDESMCQPWGDASPTEGGSDASSSESESESESGSDTAGQTDKDGGCACTSAPSSAPAGLLLLVALLRRRRRA